MDADRPVYRVQPDRAQWRLTRNDEILQHFGTKADAVEEGRKLARAAHPSQLVVHDPDGTIQVESIY